MNEPRATCILARMTSRTPRRSACVFALLSGLAFVAVPATVLAQEVPSAEPTPPAAEPSAAATNVTAPPPSSAPPPPSPPPSLPSELQAKPNVESSEKPKEEESSRLSELLFLNAELGASYVNMRTFSVENLGITNADGGGFMAGVGVGVRIVVLSLGAKLRWHKLSPFNLVQANGELLFKLPISSVDILIGAHGGYSGVGSLNDLFAGPATSAATADQLATNVSIRGWNAGLDLGFDYFFNNYFSLGLGITGDFLYLQRPKSTPPAGFDQLPADVQAQYLNSDVYKYDGKSAGFGMAGALRVGFHLGP